MTLLALVKIEVKAYDADTIVDALQAVMRGIAIQGYISGEPRNHGGVPYTIIVRQTSKEPVS